jgi:hypothetical protein
MNSLEKASWISWGNKKVSEIESFIQTWPHKGCSSFHMGEAKFDFSKRRTTSKGGLVKFDGVWTPFINIAMYNYTQPINVYRFYEYKSYDDDKVIGGFYSNNNEHRITALICHEMAHAIQFWHKYYNNIQNVKPHGDEFKKYYAALRQVFLNNDLPDQTDMGARYRELKKIAIFQELGPIRRAA